MHPKQKNDLKEGESFKTKMAAKDGSVAFNFGGVYTTFKKRELIEYTMDDARKVSVSFSEKNGKPRSQRHLIQNP